MKQINNYILEKLHIGKDYNNNHEMTRSEFMKYLESNGYKLRWNSLRDDNDMGDILPIKGDYPKIAVGAYEKYFCIYGTIKQDKLKIFDKQFHSVLIDFEKENFDMVPKEDSKTLMYTSKNADEIINILKKI